MPSYARIALGVAVFSVGISSVMAQEPATRTKVELRWVENEQVEGLTESEGFQCSCDPQDLVYPHMKPALVLTSVEVAKVTVTNSDLSKNGLSSENYMVKIQLTQNARDKLAATVEGEKTRWLTVLVDDKYWGVRCYEKSKTKRVSPDCRAETFNVGVGFFSSRAEAEQLVDALKGTPEL